MNAGWQPTTIGEICTIVNGGTPKTGVAAYWGGPHRWITPAEMGERSSPYVDETERTITDEGLQNSSARPLPPHSVILSSRAPIGHLVINTVPMATNQGCKGLVPRGDVDPKFLYYYLSSVVDLLNELGSGTTFKELSGGKLKEVPIAVPSMAQQQRIVRLLDEALAGIATAKANAEKNLQNASLLFGTAEHQIFARNGARAIRRPLGELVSFRNGINYTKSSRGERVHVVGVGAFQDHFTVPDQDLDEVAIDGKLDDLDLLKQGDLLTVRSNGNPALIGRCMLAEHVRGRVTHSGFTIRLRPNTSDVVPSYLCYFMRSADTRSRLAEGGTGTSIKSLNQAMLSELAVPVPSIMDQRRLVGELSETSATSQRLRALYQQKGEALNQLKASLLQQAFSGAL